MKVVNVLIGLVLLASGFTVALFYLRGPNISLLKHQSQPTPQPTVEADEKYISGKITGFRNNLAVDGNCTVKVHDAEIEIAASGEQKPGPIPHHGSISGIICEGATDDLSSYVGKKVEAFGKWNGYYLTMIGKDDYFIRVELDNSLTKPPIVDAFLCGDYCPGPKESYTQKVFQGVNDPQECTKLGGIPGSFIAWGETKYCLAPKLQTCPQTWASNRMPCAGYCGPSEAFVVNGEKFNETYVDVDWVQKNCSIKPSVSY